jgi:hypothetical protein
MASNWNNQQSRPPMGGGMMGMRPQGPPQAPQGAEPFQEPEAPQEDVGKSLVEIISGESPLANKAQQIMGVLRGPQGAQARELLKNLMASAGEPVNGDDNMLVNAVLRLAEKSKSGEPPPEEQQASPQPPMPPPQAPMQEPPPMPQRPSAPQPMGPSQPWNR